jgi:hypothetical protein
MALQSTRDLFVCRSLRANPRSVTLSSPAGQHRIDGRYQIIMDQEIWEKHLPLANSELRGGS